MTTARHLDTIDLLRSRGFPAEPGPSDVGTEGPGFHLAELSGPCDEAADGDGDADAAAEQRGAEHEALLDALTERWGEPDLFSLASTQLRSAAADEEVPEPWRRLGVVLGWLYLWRIEGRWIAVGLSGHQLLAAVTDADPP